MFGVFVKDHYEGDSSFKIFQTMDEAREYDNIMSCMGFTTIVFDYDKDGDVFVEFYF